MAALPLIDALRKRGAPYELIRHRHTETAAAEARAVGVPPEQTAKTVVVRADDRLVRAVVPATRRVDLSRLASLLGVDAVALVSETELVGAYPDYEIGAVPPFDASFADEIVLDSRLAALESLVFDAGSHEESLRMRASDLVELSRPTVGDISEPEEH